MGLLAETDCGFLRDGCRLQQWWVGVVLRRRKQCLSCAALGWRHAEWMRRWSRPPGSLWFVFMTLPCLLKSGYLHMPDGSPCSLMLESWVSMIPNGSEGELYSNFWQNINHQEHDSPELPSSGCWEPRDKPHSKNLPCSSLEPGRLVAESQIVCSDLSFEVSSFLFLSTSFCWEPSRALRGLGRILSTPGTNWETLNKKLCFRSCF